MASTSSSSSSSDSEQEPVVSKRTRPAPEDDSSDSDTDSDTDAAPEATEDAPVLSHAEQRKEKKRAAKAAVATTDDAKLPTKKRKLNDGKAEKINPSQRKNSVWVGNMAFKTTTDDLRSFFAGCGEITRIHMPTKPSTRPGGGPENRGFAYVDFATEDAKTLAIARSENPLAGRKLLIKDGKSFEGRPVVENAPGSNLPGTYTKTAQKILKQQKQPPAPTLFLGNLGFNTTEESIKELLNAHRTKPRSAKVAEGEEAEAPDADANWIRKVRMGTFEDSGLCKGFAFVDFSSIENSTSALVNSKNHKLDGRDLVVEYASADAVRRGASRALDGSKTDRPSFDSKRRERQSPRNIRKAKAAPAATGETEEHASQEAPAVAESAPPREDGREFSKHGKTARFAAGPKSRPRPGAALALAKRESAAIIPSKGSKITFD
ncbi:hypothetical protein BDV98DRAFT_542009 [Pterulicium gracile]|uniref:RRM domain-containing protein n=1 Tax=Pterulicium gracile TaxID=1884261 RepID=A0A5C3QZ94_9AGAR|nr:hypothetical protein BDV98DRAFT_542009 [Pterula gracilis]